jgi:hypothetical protein
MISTLRPKNWTLDFLNMKQEANFFVLLSFIGMFTASLLYDVKWEICCLIIMNDIEESGRDRFWDSASASERSYVKYSVGYCIVMFYILSVFHMINKYDVLGTGSISALKRLIGCPYRPFADILLFPLFLTDMIESLNGVY